jgi:hypothetical protein
MVLVGCEEFQGEFLGILSGLYFLEPTRFDTWMPFIYARDAFH